MLLLVFVVLGVYYPAISGGLNSVDDWNMFQYLENSEGFDLKGLFVPGTSFYYRPLLMLTFIADHYLWGGEASFYHLENILLHVANVLLIFLLAQKVFARASFAMIELPLAASLLFALHPINTESVNWISGRTDVLATFFVLLSLLILLRGLDVNRLRWVLAASLTFAAAIISKETVLFFFPAACFILWRWPASQTARDNYPRRRLVAMACFAAPYLLGASIYVVWRIALHAGHDAGFHHLLTNYRYDAFDTGRVFFKVLGFYVKKLFIPAPLNFAIRQVSDHYVWLGLLAFGLTLFAATRRSLPGTFAVVAIYQILPAIIIALVGVAWTPLAERYLYLPSAFFCLAIPGVVGMLLKRGQMARLALPLCVLLVLPATALTAQRNVVWQDNQRLYQDTLEKSPDFTAIRNELAIALMQKGRGAEAERHLLQGQGSTTDNVLLYVNHAALRLNDGHPQEAREILLPHCTEKDRCHPEALRMLARVDEKRYAIAEDAATRNFISADLVDTYEVLWRRSGDTFFLYRAGQLVLFSGDKPRAADYFAKAFADAPRTSHYKEAAGKLAAKLRTE